MSILKQLQDASSLKDIANLLGYKASGLSFLVYKLPPEKKYENFSIPKKTGGVREINAPVASLKRLQRSLADVLYDCRDEIDAKSGLKPLSHGFRKQHSIVTNAWQHKKRKYVLNLDLQDFFPSFNFGRVRGFFIKNQDFKLNEKIATIIAQIACHDNKLPQGSPCSPIISDLLAHLLDVRLAQLAKKNRATYSRYADDITFSTNQEMFPASLAARDDVPGSKWVLGGALVARINKSGFSINETKTRMQCNTGRQLVTGLTVNRKVNIRQEYYRTARVMCHSLFRSGEYYRPITIAASGPSEAGSSSGPEPISALSPIEGILSHIYHVKDLADFRKELEKKEATNSTRKLYASFLAYRYFVALKRPLIICEGKTDSVYLKYAIEKLTEFHPQLGAITGGAFSSAISFFSYTNKVHHLLELEGGADDLKKFLVGYKTLLKKFKHRPLEHPVIVLIDNDAGARGIFSFLNQNFKYSISHKSFAPFFHVCENLYLVKTPELGSDGASCIENFFKPLLLATKLDGKKFSPDSLHVAADEYGKVVFAEKVVRQNAKAIDFSDFAPLLGRIVSVIEHYSPPANPASASSGG